MLLDHQIIPQSVQKILVPAQKLQVQTWDLIDPARHLAQPGQLLARGA